MLAFHFIDSKHVAIPVYTRLFSIKSAAKHLASCTWGIHYVELWDVMVYVYTARVLKVNCGSEQVSMLDDHNITCC